MGRSLDYKVAEAPGVVLWCETETNQAQGVFWQQTTCKAHGKYAAAAVLWVYGPSEPGQRKTETITLPGHGWTQAEPLVCPHQFLGTFLPNSF